MPSLLQLSKVPGVYVDHINGNNTDNRLSNLRACTQSQNLMNSRLRTDNTAGYKGVSYFNRDSCYRAYITVNKKQLHLGYFASAVQAAIAYNNAAIQHFGEFAKLNEVSP